MGCFLHLCASMNLAFQVFYFDTTDAAENGIY